MLKRELLSEDLAVVLEAAWNRRADDQLARHSLWSDSPHVKIENSRAFSLDP